MTNKRYGAWIAPITIGKRIWTLRKEKGWTQDELATFSGVTRQYLNMLENEYRGSTNPSIIILAKIAVPFGMSVSELLSGVTIDIRDENEQA